jgi:hypothetical protein
MFATRRGIDPMAHRTFRFGAIEVHVENPEPLALAYDDIPGDAVDALLRGPSQPH